MAHKHAVADIERGIEHHAYQRGEKHGAEQRVDLPVSKVEFVSFHNSVVNKYNHKDKYFIGDALGEMICD